MATTKQKYYVVWHGLEPGVYTTWPECQRQVKGFEGAVYKSFATRQEAEEAYRSPASDYVRPRRTAQTRTGVSGQGTATDCVPPTYEAWAVDAACSGNPGPMEYRGVCLRTGREVFRFGPAYGTNNIGEFLAIVHALALIGKSGERLTIYSDSRNALAWVRQKKCKTKLPLNAKTRQVHELIGRAEAWLRSNSYETPLVKWDTKAWGEIPADFGRK